VRAAYFTQQLLPHLPQDRQLIVGGDFNCIAAQLDLLDPAVIPGTRLTGYHDGLRHVEAEGQLFDTWREHGSLHTQLQLQLQLQLQQAPLQLVWIVGLSPSH
jgi:exonuclease III